MTRSEAREQAFILLFEKIFNPEQTLGDMKAVAEECGTFVVDEFAERLGAAAIDYTPESDKLIEANLRGWKLTRLPKTCCCVFKRERL